MNSSATTPNPGIVPSARQIQATLTPIVILNLKYPHNHNRHLQNARPTSPSSRGKQQSSVHTIATNTSLSMPPNTPYSSLTHSSPPVSSTAPTPSALHTTPPPYHTTFPSRTLPSTGQLQAMLYDPLRWSLRRISPLDALMQGVIGRYGVGYYLYLELSVRHLPAPVDSLVQDPFHCVRRSLKQLPHSVSDNHPRTTSSPSQTFVKTASYTNRK